MNTTTLSGLRDYLYGTLSMADMIWLCKQLADYVTQKQNEENLTPYTMEELRAGILESEKQFAEGKYKTLEEVFQGFDEYCDKEIMLEAV